MLKKNSFLFFKRDKISPERKALLVSFAKGLAIKFSDICLLDLAFQHRSVSNEQAGKHENNERLEFLGDSVLGMCAATYLYEFLKDKPEGDLSKIKSVVVSEVILSQIALDIGIDRCLSLGRGEELTGGRKKKAILADALEAIIGAYYLDAGYAATEKLVRVLLVPEILKVQENRYAVDCKSLLQEFYQKHYKQCPVYKLEKMIGPEHDRTFFVSVHLQDAVYGPETGKTKKEAEQAAARSASLTLGLLKQ
ncbi:MAG: ribonuclease III [Treponema sp.]|jgi:ribonuclease-3|nr:ribonuclease III [Treponema sp.]